MIIPAFGKYPKMELDLSKTTEGLRRLVEAKMVNPYTYNDLEFCFNEAYRELIRHNAQVGFQLDMADKSLESAKADFLLDKYPDLIKDRPKSQDSADLRKAFLMRDADYVAALDRVALLKAIQAHVEGRIKVFERTCQYMRKQMDIMIRSGMDSKHYLTHQNRGNNGQ